MTGGTFAAYWLGQVGWRLGMLASLFILLAVVACSAAAPTASPTVAPSATPALPTPTATVAAPLPTATATPVPTPTLPPPTATALPTPTATAAPSPTAAAQDELAAASEKVFGLVEELVAELGHREGGTEEEFRAAERLKARLDRMGYVAEIRPFTNRYFDWAKWPENVSVTVESPPFGRLPISGLPLTAAPQGGSGTGPLLLVGARDPGDLPPEELGGKVILMQPESLAVNNPESLRSLKEKVNKAAAAGAVGVGIIPDVLIGIDNYQPLVEADAAIPALVFLPEVAQGAIGLLPEGEIIVTVTIVAEELESWNVVAELEGDGDDVVIVGGHYDVAPETFAGANDNTSGIAVVLSLAEALAGERLLFTVRFIAFGAEELGLYGSRNYVGSLSGPELGRIRAMLNFDVVGTGARLSVDGQPELAELALELAADLGIEAEPGSLPPGASGDHEPFVRAGKPVLLFYGPDVSRIHTAEDRLEFVQPELLGGAFLVAEAVLRSGELGR